MSDFAEHTPLSFAPDPGSSLGYVPRFLTRWRLTVTVQILDIAAVMLAALALYPVTGSGFSGMPARYVVGALIAAFICHVSFSQARLYDVEALLDETRSIKSVLIRWSLIFLGLAATSALAHQADDYSRAWFAAFYGGGAALLAGQRAAVGMLLRRWIRRGYVTRSVVLVGANELAAGLMERLEHNRSGVRVVGVFDDRMERCARSIRGVPVLGTVDDLLEFTRTHECDLVVVTLPIAASARLNAVVAKLRHQPLNVRVLPGEIGLDRVSPIRLSRRDLPGVQLIAVADRPLSEVALMVKGMIDRLVAAVGLLAVAPIWLLIAAGIAMSSPGPILAREVRVGYRGRLFQIYKFRTTRAACEREAGLAEHHDAPAFPFGALLRKLNVDELPQLINVLKGDMSLVGPRPHRPNARAAGKLYFEAVNEYAGRHRVKPGITGWAQVNGWRGPAETLEQIERRVEHDIYYVENWSLMLDAVILIKTALVGLFGKTAV